LKKRFLSVGGAVLAALMLAAGACGGDDSGDNAEDTAGALEEFSNDFNATDDLVLASDDVKGSLGDNCDELRANVESDDLDGFCEALGDAIDDDDQQAFQDLKSAWPAIESQVRADIAADIQDAATDDDNDNPLEGGDPGDDDGNDDTDDDDVDRDDVENPLDNE
jgi:hypothetical protein